MIDADISSDGGRDVAVVRGGAPAPAGAAPLLLLDKCEVPLLEPDLAHGQRGRGREARRGAPRGGQLARVQLPDQLLQLQYNQK